MVSTGLRLVIGSWKIIESLSPRTLRISSSGSCKRSRPSRRITPSTLLLAAGRSRMTESAVTLLPDPDSPTMATVWRVPTSKDKASTAGRQTLSTRKATERSRTERTA